MEKRNVGRPFGTFKGAFSHKRHPLYNKWIGMRQRCSNPKSHIWKYYGGRGIIVCERWNNLATGFENFIADMGERPSLGHSVERINNDGNYEPANCKWATAEEQCHNRRKQTLNPKRPNTLWQKCKRAGMPYLQVRCRVVKLGWSEQEALSTPINRHHQAASTLPTLEGFVPLPESAFQKIV
jgi:hypothetical protein